MYMRRLYIFYYEGVIKGQQVVGFLEGENGHQVGEELEIPRFFGQFPYTVTDPVCNGEWKIWRYCERSEFTISYQVNSTRRS